MAKEGVSLFVSMPCHRSVEALTAAALLRLSQALPKGVAHFDIPCGESLVQRARNEAVARFLASDKTHLLFIDSDVVFEPKDVGALVASGKELIGGLYPQKWIDWEAAKEKGLAGFDAESAAKAAIHYNVNVVGGKVTAENGLYLPVKALATGFLLIARGVFTRMIEKFPETEYVTEWHVTPDTPNGLAKRWSLFDCFIDQGRYLSEDYGFSWRALKCGIQPYAHLGIRNLSHVGSYEFKGDVVEFLTGGEEG